MKKETVYILLCYILWGSMPIFWKQLAEVSSIYILASRIVWSFLFCSLILVCKSRFFSIKEVFKNGKESILLLCSGVLICANWGLYIFAVNSNRIIETSLAYYLTPIFSVLLGVLIYKEKLNKLQWAAVLLATIGVFVSIFAYGQFPWLSIVLCLTFGLYSLIKKQIISSSDTTIVIETLLLLPVAGVFLFYSESMGQGALGVLSGWQFLLLPLTGILTSLPLLFFSAGIKKTPLTVVGIIMFVSPTISLIIATAVYGEPFTPIHAITFGFIWVAVTLFVISGFKTKYARVVKKRT